MGVSAIAVDYTNSDVIYIGTGDDDGGDTYSIGMFKSTDGGSTWNEVTPGTASLFGTRIYRIIIHPTDHNTVFIASASGCFKSTDAGASWSLLRSGTWRDMELKPNDPNTIYLANKSFARSVNGGASWTTTTIGLPNSVSVNRAEIAVSPDNPDYVYFLAGKNSDASFLGLYRSNNDGVSFSMQANTPNLFAYDMQGNNATAGQSWYDMALTVSPQNAEEVYVGGINVWRSLDGGLSWDIKTHWVYPPNVAYVHADIHTLEIVGNRLYCGSDGGIFISTNQGDNFADLSPGLSITQFYRIGGSEQVPHKVMGGTQDNGCNLIENNNARHIQGADGMETLIAPNDSLIIYTSSQNGGFRRSDDGGQTSSGIFPTKSGEGAWVTPLAMNPQDNDMLLAGFDQVYISLNRGSSDQAISNFSLGGQNLRHIAIAPSAGYSHFYAATYDELMATFDAGATWNSIHSGLPNAAISSITVHPTNPIKLWVTFSGIQDGEKVYVTEDGGVTWTNISSNLPNLPVNCLVHQNGTIDGIYIGTDVGIYYTDGTLAGWQQYSTGLPNVIVRDLEINYTVGKLRAGTYGRGLWESDLKQAPTTPPVANFTYSSTQLCPNDSIQFSDASVDHAPGWEWHFPGGSPSSSTERNPKVMYPGTGIYNVMLIVQNPNGVDTTTQNITFNYNPNVLDFDIQMDGNSAEVAWKVTDTTGATEFYNSPLFALTGNDNQLLQQQVCLPAGCYKLIMIDLGSDGLCCTNGNGYYLLTNTNGDTIAYGDSYGNADTTLFCVNMPTPLATGASITNADCGSNNGALNLLASGGDGNYQYSIDNGVTFTSSSSFNSLPAGSYNIVVNDGQGMQGSSTVVINSIGAPTAVASASANTVYLNQGGATNFFSTNSTNAGSILWTFPDGSTSTAADPTFTFVNDGVQQVVLTVTSGACNDSDTLDITVVNNVSIQEIENNAAIKIIPNPISDKFVLDIEFTNEQEQVEIIIQNAVGQRVFWQEVEQIKAFNQSIHFGNEPSGVYIVTILNENMAISKRFIKQ